MDNGNRVVTANLQADLVSRLDEAVSRSDRSRSWFVRQALAEYLTEEERRHELTLEALRDVEKKRTFTQAEVEHFMAERRDARRRAQS